MLCVGGVDPTNFLFPEPGETIFFKSLHFNTRLFLAYMAFTQLSAILGTSHLALFIYFIYFNKCVGYLKSYQRQFPNPIGKKAKLKPNPSKFASNSDTELYRVISVLFRVGREFTDSAALFVMGPGFFIDVTCNYVMVMKHEKVAILLYLLVALVGVVVHTIILVEVPQADDCHARSSSLIKHWKKTYTKKGKLRQKIVNSFRPVGIWVGSFFVMGRETLFLYVDEILKKTIDFILLV